MYNIKHLLIKNTKNIYQSKQIGWDIKAHRWKWGYGELGKDGKLIGYNFKSISEEQRKVDWVFKK